MLISLNNRRSVTETVVFILAANMVIASIAFAANGIPQAFARTVLLQDTFDTENNGSGQLNANFTNWDVTDGTVDLIGNNFFDLYPGNGLYVDLDGSTGNAGRMESKTTFLLSPGTCDLSFELGGSQRGDTNTVDVSLGILYSESFTLDSIDPLTLFTRTIAVSSAASAELVFDHAGGDNFGLILDDVTLICTEEVIPPDDRVVGGEILGIDMTSLFVAGTAANAYWILPVFAAFAGVISLALVRRKRRTR